MVTTRTFDSDPSADPRLLPLPVEVYFAGQDRDPSLARQVCERIERSFARFRSRIVSAHVRVRDVSGDRGGVDQLCSIELTLTGGGRLYVTEQADQVQRAIARLVQRVRRVLAERRRHRA